MAGSNYCIMRIEKIKNLVALGRAYNHNYRTTRSAAPNALENLRDRNQELIKDDFGIKDRNFVKIFREKVRDSEYYQSHKVRKNAVPAIELLLSYSKEQDGEFDIEEWKAENVKWLHDTFSEKNVISAMFHDDEKDLNDRNGTGRHIHAIVFPFDKRGCLNASDIVGGRKELMSYQAEYANRMAKFGLIRGEMGKKDRHLSPALYHKRVNEEVTKGMEYIPAPEEKETAAEYAKRLEQSLWQIARDHTDALLDLERERYRKKQEDEIKKKKQSLDDKLKALEDDQKARKLDRDFTELRQLLGWGDDMPTRTQMHEAKKKLRIANNLREAFHNYPDHEFALKVNEDMATILRHHRDMQKQRKEHDMTDLVLGDSN